MATKNPRTKYISLMKSNFPPETRKSYVVGKANFTIFYLSLFVCVPFTVTNEQQNLIFEIMAHSLRYTNANDNTNKFFFAGYVS